jgi:hypothetical protein
MYSMHVTTASIEGKYWKCWTRRQCSESDPGTLSTIWSFLLLPKCNYGTIYLPHMLAHRSTSKCNQPIYTKWARQHLGKWRWDFGEASKFLESCSPKVVIIMAAVYHLDTVRAATWCWDIVELANAASSERIRRTAVSHFPPRPDIWPVSCGIVTRSIVSQYLTSHHT